MSLDVYLKTDKKHKVVKGSGIFVRQDGKTKEITREEWDRLHPNREPNIYHSEEEYTDEIYHDNITHNLGEMADKAGIYYALWRPEEKGFKTAGELVSVLEEGLRKLKADPNEYKQYNPDNGWGNYDGLVQFVEGYLNMCKAHPESQIIVSR